MHLAVPHKLAIAVCGICVFVALSNGLPAADVPQVRDAAQSTTNDQGIDWSKAQEFWSFRVPVPQPAPAVKNATRPRQPLDYFVLSRFEKKNLSPMPEADRRTLIRRVTFDLTGLPPTPAEVDLFVNDSSADAYDRLVDRLLSSKSFGERMASMWLPLARFAEDQAHQVGNDTQFFYPNAWRYRAWVIDAFNRDLPYDRFVIDQLAADKTPDADASDLPALGFIGLGPKYYNRGRLDVQASEWEDRVDTVTRTFLGLTVACARCHDHKFDPITQADYYALAGVFASTQMVNKTESGKVLEGKMTAQQMPTDTMHIVQDGNAQDLPVYVRGDVDRPGEKVSRRFLRILSAGEPSKFVEGSGRLELAQDIASAGNPLTARVMVNRVWAMFFAKPLVPTPSNFGHSGMAPVDAQLLDDLAVRFMDRGWSVKTLVREIVTSATYRQKAGAPIAAAELPGYVARRRLTVEQWRDATLFFTGELSREGGKSMEVDDPANLRRTVFSRVSRLKLNDLLMQFDYPDANVHAEKRAVTTTAIQKLFMLNSPFMSRRATALAKQFTSDPNESDEARAKRVYRTLFAREATPLEIELATQFLSRPTTSSMTRWEQYAQVLLASDEMLYVD
jgi:hypothetical protein